MDERFLGEAAGGDGVFTGVGGSVGSDMDRMRPKDAFAGEFCEAKGGGGGPLRAGVDGVRGGGGFLRDVGLRGGRPSIFRGVARGDDEEDETRAAEGRRVSMKGGGLEANSEDAAAAFAALSIGEANFSGGEDETSATGARAKGSPTTFVRAHPLTKGSRKKSSKAHRFNGSLLSSFWRTSKHSRETVTSFGNLRAFRRMFLNKSL